MDRTDFEIITEKRHEAHCADEWIEYREAINAVIDAAEELSSEHDLPELSLSRLDPEDPGYCDSDECNEYCDRCKEIERQYVFDVKDKNNTIIEEWMSECEEHVGMDENEIRPTGMARARWAENI